MGDAAHPMYPFGGNGAAQAVLDAKTLAAQLANADGDVTGALNAYEQERREKVYGVVMSNRQGGPERVIDFALSRLSGPDVNLEDVAPFEERKAIVHQYAQIAGHSTDQLRSPVSSAASSCTLKSQRLTVSSIASTGWPGGTSRRIRAGAARAATG
jgi:5-methylphenazine-1-carboxylate 1-monooxygenase